MITCRPRTAPFETRLTAAASEAILADLLRKQATGLKLMIEACGRVDHLQRCGFIVDQAHIESLERDGNGMLAESRSLLKMAASC